MTRTHRTVARGAAVSLALAVLSCGAGTDPASSPDDTRATRAVARSGETAPNMPPEDVLFGMRGKEHDVRRCFEPFGGPSRSTVHVTWRVGVSGEVEDVHLEPTTTGVTEVDECIATFVAGLHYGRRDTPATAAWTFVHGLAKPDIEKLASKRRGKRPTHGDNGAVIDARSPGKLPTAAIENVAEHGFRLYAYCLREGLNREPSLSGRVLLRFTIDPTGRVRSVADAGSDLPDPEVIDCVAQGFYAMRFPKPDGGIVRLSYAVLLN